MDEVAAFAHVSFNQVGRQWSFHFGGYYTVYACLVRASHFPVIHNDDVYRLTLPFQKYLLVDCWALCLFSSLVHGPALLLVELLKRLLMK